ncbi:MAG TPA: methyltransferase domain-containing protein [Luteitalea sp.]|nr:methyltransferase domain-containing protein [Luteitalea sp.]
MSNPFADAAMAAGYAAARPAVHPQVIAMLRAWLGSTRFARAVDLGCGAGLSTRPLLPLADECIGFDPSEAMVRAAGRVVPAATFLAAHAEAMPFGAATVDLMAAAGSLNYTRDLAAVWPESRRVLGRRGRFAIYDFSPGRSFGADSALQEWFTIFTGRYPYPRSQARPLSPDILASLTTGFETIRAETFELPVSMTADDYLAYMLTETSVQAATQAGTPLDEIRSFAAETLPAVFGDRSRDVRFTGYLALLSPV